MTIGSLGKIGLGTCSMGALGVVASAGILTAKRAKTHQGEQAANNLQTGLALGALAGMPYATKLVPAKSACKIFQNTGFAVEKAINYVGNKSPKIIQQLTDKLNSTKLGPKILETGHKVANKVTGFVKNNKVLSEIVNKSKGALNKFMNASTKQKGKYALIATGVTLLAGLATKVITNHYKKSGAIDYKYNELYKDYQKMIAFNPIMDARTGEAISFEDYCKCAQTIVK